jgi:hypothetical protein
VTVPRPSVRPAPRGHVGAPHRRLRLAGALASVGVRTALLPRNATRRRGRTSVCGAARILTAAGVRVRVVAPPVPWPRTGGRLVVNGSLGRLDELAVLTAVPRSVDGWAELAERALGGRRSASAPADADVLLPVSVRHRWCDDGPWLTDDQVPRDPAAALHRPGLVVEVRLLPALRAADR